MNAQTETFEEEYEEYDEFDEEDDGERGLSGLVVLLMGIVMLGAFASVVWIAYQQGVKTADARNGAPYVAADPEPLKIENNEAQAATADADRSVYDRLDGAEGDPVETLAAAPEEPVARSSDDPIAAIASSADEGAGVVDDAVADRIATLAAADDELAEQPAAAPTPKAETPRATTPTPAATEPRTTTTAAQPELPPAPTPVATSSGEALSGTHLVQVGAFGSQNEADTNFSRMQTKFGDLFNGKNSDVERADLGAKGVFFRLRIGPFASSAEAKTFCDGLKARGQDCLIKSK